MPFDAAFNDVYQLGIKQVCESLGAYCERVDEQVFDGRILDRIYNQIAKADIVVADMTGRNPNVFYEVGYAHGLDKKRMIMLTQRSEDIPFDLKDYPHIIYERQITKLREELDKKLRWCIEHPLERLSKVDSGLELFHKGDEITDGFWLQIDQIKDYPLFGQTIEISIDIHNPLPIVNDSDFSVGLVIPAGLTFPDGIETAEFSFGEKLAVLPNIARIYPEGWSRLTFRVSRQTGKIAGVHSCQIYLYTRMARREFTGNITVIKNP
jgi:hypothetical protein